ncbi:unnamed protein product [Prorocentrum cordatum]|uniref:RNase H type-1 domain-containing protein n=1 Tax=Prorocentrum cordatum TaxID=2364126 RepID=A0ABN9REF0_9DINO|nr:unnamed protein product [Polarella glacialis]
MLAPMDELMRLAAHQPRTPAICADELTVQIRAALRDLELSIARHKARVTSSRMQVAREVARRLRRHGFRACQALEVLGVEARPGRPLRFSSLRKRARRVHARLPRFRRLRGLGAQLGRLTRASLPAALQCSLPAMGAPPTLVAMMRRMLRQGWGRLAAGSSTWLAACLEPGARAEPQLAAWTQPLFNWALMAVDPRTDRSDMQRSWQLQAPSVLLAPRPLRKAMGPACAVCLALRDLGWGASFAFAWRADEGDVLDLHVAAPSTVQQLARQSAARAMWRRWAATPDPAPELGPVRWQPQGYWLEPLAALLHRPTTRWRLTDSGAGAVRSLVASATWSQARLRRCGYAADGLCRRCWAAPSTSVHRYWPCEPCQPERELALDEALIDGLPHIVQNDPRWARLLVPLSSLPVPPPRDDSGRWRALPAAPGFMVTGLIYADGSCLKHWSRPQAARAGWGFVIFENFRAVGGYYGAGRSFRRSNRDLWVQLWAKFDDRGGLSSNVRIVHVRGHQSGNDQHRHGNDWADALACLGSGLHCFTDQQKAESKAMVAAAALMTGAALTASVPSSSSEPSAGSASGALATDPGSEAPCLCSFCPCRAASDFCVFGVGWIAPWCSCAGGPWVPLDPHRLRLAGSLELSRPDRPLAEACGYAGE